MLAKHLKFCEEYVVDLNGTQAYIRAGYARKGARVGASVLLAKPNIRAKIAELQEIMRKDTGLTAEMVVRELMKLGFTNFRNYVDPGNGIKDIHDLEEDQSAAIESLTTTVTESDFGTKTQVKIKLASKADALEKLGRHLGIFEKDNEQKTGIVIVDITD